MYNYHDTACADGCVVAAVPNPAVSADLSKEIQQWKEQGATIDDIITRLRLRTVPTSYSAHTWQQGSYMYSVWIY